MTYRYKNENTRQVVERAERSARLDALPNWHLLDGETGGAGAVEQGTPERGPGEEGEGGADDRGSASPTPETPEPAPEEPEPAPKSRRAKKPKEDADGDV